MTLGSHQRKSQDWITPKHIIDALGPFDLDLDPDSRLKGPRVLGWNY
jgi:hypothetical protein